MLGTGASALVGGVGVESSANMPIMPTEASVATRRRVPVLRPMVNDFRLDWAVSLSKQSCLMEIAIKK